MTDFDAYRSKIRAFFDDLPELLGGADADEPVDETSSKHVARAKAWRSALVRRRVGGLRLPGRIGRAR